MWYQDSSLFSACWRVNEVGTPGVLTSLAANNTVVAVKTDTHCALECFTNPEVVMPQSVRPWQTMFLGGPPNETLGQCKGRAVRDMWPISYRKVQQRREVQRQCNYCGGGVFHNQQDHKGNNAHMTPQCRAAWKCCSGDRTRVAHLELELFLQLFEIGVFVLQLHLEVLRVGQRRLDNVRSRLYGRHHLATQEQQIVSENPVAYLCEEGGGLLSQNNVSTSTNVSILQPVNRGDQCLSFCPKNYSDRSSGQMTRKM